jgi:hypothetical protein
MENSVKRTKNGLYFMSEELKVIHLYLWEVMKHAERLVISETHGAGWRRADLKSRLPVGPREQFRGWSVDVKTRATQCLPEGNPSASRKGETQGTSLQIYLDTTTTWLSIHNVELMTNFNFKGLHLHTHTHTHIQSRYGVAWSYGDTGCKTRPGCN